MYSVDDIAVAAGLRSGEVRRRLQIGRIAGAGGYFRTAEAVRLVRALASNAPLSVDDRADVTAIDDPKRDGLAGLVTSGVMHAAFVAVLVVLMSLGLMDASSDPVQPEPTPVRLVFLATPGPGGGGGGGGLKNPLPARRAQRKPVVKKAAVSSPVPEVRPAPPPAPKPEPTPEPPKPIDIDPVVEPPKVEPPPPPAPAPAVQAPVAPAPADATNAAGTVSDTGSAASQGSGTGGGAGTGAGTGVGEGRGAGIGPGEEAGTGGGPYRAGAGIEPPRLRREVKPAYTDAARRRGVEGEVLVEIVVRRDGTVGDVRLLRRLGDGLDEKAIEAVRQWRFDPARRHGAPVDVIVEVSLQFKLR
jgi:TonB family protein